MSDGLTEDVRADAMTLEAMSRRALQQDAGRRAIEYGGRWFTWGELRHVADQVSSLVEQSGASPHAPVALMPRNRPAAAAALLALIAMGRTVRMVYAFQSDEGIIRDIEKRRPAVMVGAAEDFSAEIVAALGRLGIAAIALEEASASAVAGLERSEAETDRDAPARHLETLTSGTTGSPKQFPLSFDMLAKHLVGDNLLFDGDDGRADVAPIFMPAPLGNISGIYGILPTTLRGVPITLAERFTVAEWHQHVVRHKPQSVGLPAAGVQMVLDAEVPVEDLACLKFITTGAAPLDLTVQRAFEKRYGVPILLAYGATEFAGPVASMTMELYAEWGERKPGSVGRAVHGSQLRTIDPETGAVQPPGKEGILEVIAPRMGPAWIRTSDLAVIDEDGFLFHRGRADGAINRGGFKLLPETIERALLLHPAVSACAVAALPDRRLGQVPAAVIQLKPGAETPTLAALEAHLRKHVLATHIPTHWLFVDDLPRTPSLKTDRRAVAALLRESAGS